MRVPGLGRPVLARPVRPAPAPGGGRPGYDASPAATLRRVTPMLESEPVAWLSTVSPDGRPHLVPTWFWWDGEALLVFSKPDAVKVRNLRADPRLMVALGDPADDFAVALIEATASLEPAGAKVPEAFFRKYAAQLSGAGLDRERFREAYTQAIRVVPSRYLAWRGRGPEHERAQWRERRQLPTTPVGATRWTTWARPSAAGQVAADSSARSAGWLAERAGSRAWSASWTRPVWAMSSARG